MAVLKDEAISFLRLAACHVLSLVPRLSMLFCVYVRVLRMHYEIKFRDFYFRVLYLLAKNTKFCTSRRFPATRYVPVQLNEFSGGSSYPLKQTQKKLPIVLVQF